MQDLVLAPFSMFFCFSARAGCQVPKAKCIPRPPFFYTPNVVEKLSLMITKQNLVGGFNGKIPNLTNIFQRG